VSRTYYLNDPLSEVSIIHVETKNIFLKHYQSWQPVFCYRVGTHKWRLGYWGERINEFVTLVLKNCDNEPKRPGVKKMFQWRDVIYGRQFLANLGICSWMQLWQLQVNITHNKNILPPFRKKADNFLMLFCENWFGLRLNHKK